MTTLTTYLATTGMTQRQLAETANVSPSFLNEIVKGAKTPGLQVALRIHSATGGAVGIETLVKGYEPERVAQ